ncbi:MAG TPA: nucleotide sugar dehydrogenase [Dermatophilaceae bacterium]|nr:nucleotide sugar dehydrogenase [Dermatophilaceae bacterium]
MTTLVVIGQGYVGLPMALRAAEVGMRVYGLDVSDNVVRALNAGRSHIDDVSDADVASALEQGFTATTDPSVIGRADVVVVCVPTPLSEDGGPDLRPVEAAARWIGDHVTPGCLVVLESTTYPGTTEEVFAPIVLGDRHVEGTDVFIAFSPERINPGDRVFGVRNTPKVVGGLSPASTRAACDFYGQFVDTVVEARGAREAEMAKLLENTFRHVNIALVNEMVRFCDELDIDLWNSIDCAETKPFGFMAFRPGPGVGGHCIPVDPSYLSHRVRAKLGYAFRIVELAEEINHAAPMYVAERVGRLLNDRERSVKGSTILLVGVTYKADISDLRESPAAPLADQLEALGAHVRYHDPHVARWPRTAGVPLACVPDVYEAAAAADVVVLLQPHSAYDLTRLAAGPAPVLDTRGVVPPGPSVRRL